MSNLASRVDEARSSLRPVEWSPARSEAVRKRIHRRRRRFTLSSWALGSSALAVAVAVAIVWFAQGGSLGLEPELARLETPSLRPTAQIELGDGTRAVHLGSASKVRLVSETEALVSFSLESGKAWFEVTPSETRQVAVQIEDVRVEVLGTEFVVELEGEIVHVWVHRGKVLVSSSGKQLTVKAGEHRQFPAKNKTEDKVETPVEDEVVLAPKPVKKPQPITKEPALPRPPIAKEKAEPKAPVDIETADEEPLVPKVEVALTPVPASEEVAELWKKADAGRLSGNKDQAISALTKLLGKHKDDPRAALAAFTLGRVLIDANRSPVVAARAFAKARKLAPAGPLVEDALLREIEAWFEAGDTRRVQKRSEKYYRLFPKGRYLKQVRELGEEL